MFTVGADAWPVIPAALALVVAALLRHDCSFTDCLLQFYLADDAKSRELLESELIDEFSIFIVTVDSNTGLLVACDWWFEGFFMVSIVR